ncbi:hypothetical protein ABTY59_16425 [Streptomyces sp. NPDC096079]|uniref:hypothetical protein n=1 Tax=unclassified Streptomyces TaxID=2593676 RepID=UPI00331DEE53
MPPRTSRERAGLRPAAPGPLTRTLAALAGAGLALTALTGCGDTGTTGTTTPTAAAGVRVDESKWPRATPETGLARGLVLPLQQYMQTYQDSVVIERAARSLQTRCMADFGFTVVFPPVGTNPPPNADDANMSRRYGITDRAMAEKYGFGIPPDTTEHPAPPKLTAAAVAVLTGRKGLDPRAEPAPATYQGKKIPEDGCQGASFDRIGARIDFGLSSRLDHDSLVKSQESPGVRAAVKAWSGCMRKKGYAVADPYAAIDLVPRVEGAETSPKEISAALADIDCKKETDLVRVWHRTETALQTQQVERNQLALQQLKEKNLQAVKAAEAALRG